jgi:8-oxo-dGTP pyrophosphatase MutT (NUDIX family)
MTTNKHIGNSFCTNCGSSGHVYRNCMEPVSSYGVLVFRYLSKQPLWSQKSEFCKDSRCSTGVNSMIPQVLLIQRKHTLGYMDIMRGKYKITDRDYISKQLKGITFKEKEKLLHGEFNEMWDELWNTHDEYTEKYAMNKSRSESKLQTLRTGVESEEGSYTLDELLRQETVFYESPEWGFPKGRRNNKESDSACAYRELYEETGIHECDLLKVINTKPFVEQFYGSNSINYRHTYFLAMYVGSNVIQYDKENLEMSKEISNIAWKTLDEAFTLIRAENLEKRGIALQLATFLRNYAPILREPLHIQNNQEEQQETYVFQRI